jgi:hypothetical protein
METEPQAAESRRKIAGYELFVRHDGRAVTEFRSAVPEHTRVVHLPYPAGDPLAESAAVVHPLIAERLG